MGRKPVRNDSRSSQSQISVDEEIRGAFGTIRAEDRTPSKTWRQRLLTLAAIMGPGIIVLVGDNDAGGVATYAQAGQNAGYSLLWTLILLVPACAVLFGSRPLSRMAFRHLPGPSRQE